MKRILFLVLFILAMQNQAFAEAMFLPQEKISQDKKSDNAKEENRIAENENSSCIKDRSPQCLQQKIDNIRSSFSPQRTYSTTDKVDTEFIKGIIIYDNKELARKILTSMPIDADPLRMQLLFVAHDDKDAMTMLYLLKEIKKEGTDYGAVWALIQRGDLDEAFDIAKTAVNWNYSDPTGHSMEKHSGFCPVNVLTVYPRPIGILAVLFAQKKQYDKAYEAAQLLNNYWDNNLNGRGFYNCNRVDVKLAYEDAMFGLITALSEDGQMDRAKKIYNEIKVNAQKMRIDLSDIQKIGQNSKIEVVYDMPQIANIQHMSYNLKVARADIMRGNQENAKAILDGLESYLGKGAQPIDNVQDYINFADISFEIGNKAISSQTLKKGLEIYAPLSNQFVYEGLGINGAVAILYAKMGDDAALENWVKNNDIDYNSMAGSTFSNILDYFAKNDLWAKFDSFITEEGAFFKNKASSNSGDIFYIRSNLLETLMKKKQFDRYVHLIDVMDTAEYQHYEFGRLIAMGFNKIGIISDSTMKSLWAYYVAGCIISPEATVDKKNLGCYMELLEYLQNNKMALLSPYSNTLSGQ